MPIGSELDGGREGMTHTGLLGGLLDDIIFEIELRSLEFSHNVKGAFMRLQYTSPVCV
jgi:hypothetical protein